jgi:hypothetical protein
MAITEDATKTVIQSLGITGLSAHNLVSEARVNGAAHGFGVGNLSGVMIVVHHAGGGLFMVEVS